MASPPVDPRISRVTSGYGVRPGRTSGAPTYHAGADFRASVGDPVFAADTGIVEFLATNEAPRGTRGYGNTMAIRGADGFRTVYAHMSRVVVAEGQAVIAGQRIGSAGNTTNGKFPGMGAHLHFEVRHPRADGGPPYPGPYRVNNVDPIPWLLERGVDARGREIVVDARHGGVGPQASLSGVSRPRSRRSSLGAIDDVTLDLGVPGLPDEPLRDPWTFDPPSGVVYVLLVSAGAAVLVGASVASKSFFRW